jgi:hypothetical protein
MHKTAILVDGAFYRKRAYTLLGEKSPADRAAELSAYCHRHIKEEKSGTELYRVFYYDCPPINKQVYHPLLKKAVALGKTKDYCWANDFFKELKHQRKFALRLGRLAEEQAQFTLSNDSMRSPIKDDLYEHIDGIRTKAPKY